MLLIGIWPLNSHYMFIKPFGIIISSKDSSMPQNKKLLSSAIIDSYVCF